MQKQLKILTTAALTALVFLGSVFLYYATTKSPPHQTEPGFTKSALANPDNYTVAHAAINNASEKIWHPAPQTSWQWQLSTPVDQSVDAQMYDIDMFSNDSSVVSSLHAKGRKVVCYISAGSVEDWRPDVSQFPATVIGKDYQGWPGEKWLDIRRIDIIGPIMEKRLDECQAKGFDGVEPDSINAYTQDTGFPLSYQDQLTYNKWWVEAAHKRGLSIGLKQDPEQAQDLQPYFDWALDEECFEFGGCDNMLPFINAHKAVFNTEYNLNTSQFCAEANKLNFNSIKKNKELDAQRETCR
jgi:hypothetical protein